MAKFEKPESHRTQEDKVKTVLPDHATQYRTIITEKVHNPALKVPSTSKEDLGMIFANIIKSRANVIRWTYDVGTDFVELTSESDIKIT